MNINIFRSFYHKNGSDYTVNRMEDVKVGITFTGSGTTSEKSGTTSEKSHTDFVKSHTDFIKRQTDFEKSQTDFAKSGANGETIRGIFIPKYAKFAYFWAFYTKKGLFLFILAFVVFFLWGIVIFGKQIQSINYLCARDSKIKKRENRFLKCLKETSPGSL